MNPEEVEIIELTQRLLDCIATGDWSSYTELCDETLTAFEPEARGHQVKGMEFHRFYFELHSNEHPTNTTIAEPMIRIMGDVALISYTRLVQQLSASRIPETAAFEETRVWQKQQDSWKHVHFHRSIGAWVQERTFFVLGGGQVCWHGFHVWSKWISWSRTQVLFQAIIVT